MIHNILNRIHIRPSASLTPRESIILNTTRAIQKEVLYTLLSIYSVAEK